MKPYTDYPPATLANMLEQADAAVFHQRRYIEELEEELMSLRKDNDDLRQEVSAWRGK